MDCISRFIIFQKKLILKVPILLICITIFSFGETSLVKVKKKYLVLLFLRIIFSIASFFFLLPLLVVFMTM
jgi:hypothetical protein